MSKGTAGGISNREQGTKNVEGNSQGNEEQMNRGM
jgi:hypothetical protein